MHEQETQHEEYEIRTGLQAGDDGLVGSGGYTGPGVGTLGSGH